MPVHHFHQVGYHDDDDVPNGMYLRQPLFFYCSNVVNDDGGILMRNTRCHLDTDGRWQAQVSLSSIAKRITQREEGKCLIYWSWHYSFLSHR